MKKKRCLCCQKTFTPDRYHPNQKYCKEPECQQTRRTTYQREKLKNDKDYRANHADSQLRWRVKHKDYWSSYRQEHPEYVKRNRIFTLQRYHRKRTVRPQRCAGNFANMYVAPLQHPVKSGRYRLLPLQENFAKKDVAIVYLSILEPLRKTG